MDDHVASDLMDVETIVPYLHKTDYLIGHDVEDEDVERVITSVRQELLQFPFMFVEPTADVIGHQESQQGRKGQRQELGVSGPPVHVGCQIGGEESDDYRKEQSRPQGRMVSGHQLIVSVDKLPEDKPATKEETTHHVAIAALYECDYPQSLMGFPAAEDEHQQADQVGDGFL